MDNSSPTVVSVMNQYARSHPSSRRMTWTRMIMLLIKNSNIERAQAKKEIELALQRGEIRQEGSCLIPNIS
ncbi:hypothetical protein KW785_02630 [Candidatus Parcubacteria bacterium]|nr:hypothetical protein [Candidatus Parcubacteria bacterium]